MWVSLTYFGNLLRPTAPKFGTHVQCDGTVQDTFRVKTGFIIQAQLPIRQTDTLITCLKWGVYATLGDPV